jgi:hypothetical protein
MLCQKGGRHLSRNCLPTALSTVNVAFVPFLHQKSVDVRFAGLPQVWLPTSCRPKDVQLVFSSGAVKQTKYFCYSGTRAQSRPALLSPTATGILFLRVYPKPCTMQGKLHCKLPKQRDALPKNQDSADLF